MRVLGVDPGLTRCGLGVVEGAPGRPLTLVAVGVVRTPADADARRPAAALESELEDWLDRHRPDAVAVERVFSQHNVRTVMGTAQASAVAILCAARARLPVALHTPSEVKAAVTGSGRADKAQVAAMVTRLLRLTRSAATRPTPPTRSRWRSATSGAGRAQPPASTPPIAATAGRGQPMIAFVDRPGRRRWLPTAPSSRSAASACPCSARPARSRRCGSGRRRQLADLAGRPRGLAHAVRLRSTRTSETVFELLQTASGVGPRLAQAMLAVHAPDALRRAVAGEDLAALTHVPGIGRKGAQRIVLELKDRLGAPTGLGARAPAAVPASTASGRLARPGARRLARARLVDPGGRRGRRHRGPRRGAADVDADAAVRAAATSPPCCGPR